MIKAGSPLHILDVYTHQFFSLQLSVCVSQMLFNLTNYISLWWYTMVWGQYLIYDQTSFDALGLSWNISIKFLILSILSLPEELSFHFMNQFLNQPENMIKEFNITNKYNFLEGCCTPYPLPTSLCLFDSLSLSLFLLWGVCHTGPHSAV